MVSRRALRSGLAAIAVLALASAAEAGNVEVGFVPFGLTHTTSEGESITALQLPGQSFFNWDRSIYLQWFATEHFAIEPQLSAFTWLSDGESVSQAALALRGNYLFSGPDAASTYVFAGGGLWHFGWDESDSETNPFLGGGIGYRHPFGSHGAVRFEVGYEHLFSGEEDEWGYESPSLNGIKVAVGLAIRF